MTTATLALMWLAGCAGRQIPEPVYDGPPRRFAVVSINDVYRINGLSVADQGGLARVRTLRAELEAEGWEVLMLHGGDVLSPSLLGRAFDGAQMVDVLGGLDGDFERFDQKMFVTMGNHEFDLDADALDARMEESAFRWLRTNVRFSKDESGAPLIDAGSMITSAMVEVGGAQVGVFGVTTAVKQPDYIASIREDYESVARFRVGALRRAGADVVIGVTHLDMAQDVALVKALGDESPELIVGGHDHVKMREDINGRVVIKADADAVTASVIKVTLGADGSVALAPEWVTLDADGPARDPEVQARVDEWEQRFEVEYCPSVEAAAGCLDEALGSTGVELVLVEAEVRRYETNSGSFVADAALASFNGEDGPGADIAFINSGSLRMGEDIPADTALTRRHIEELMPYPSPLKVVAIDGATLQAIVDHSVEDWTGSGHWLQVAGFGFVHDPEAGTATQLSLFTEDGPRLIAPDETIRAVTGNYLLEPKWGDQDGYSMLSQELVVAEGLDLKAVLVDAFSAEIAPVVEGRICNTQREGPCLIPGE